jgi:hypothetical protein
MALARLRDVSLAVAIAVGRALVAEGAADARSDED